MCVCARVCVRVCVYTCVYVHVCVCVHVSMHVCTCVYACMCVPSSTWFIVYSIIPLMTNNIDILCVSIQIRTCTWFLTRCIESAFFQVKSNKTSFIEFFLICAGSR